MGHTHSNTKPTIVLQDPSSKVPILWLGSLDDAVNLPWLLDKKITLVINLSQETLHLSQYPREIQTFSVNIPDKENAPLIDWFPFLGKKIHQHLSSGGRVLVHCLVGRSRSSSIVLCYLIRYHKKPLNEALQWLRDRRAIVRPNNGFLRALARYEKEKTVVASA